MSLQEFCLSVRSGSRFLSPTVAADSPRIDAAKIEHMLQDAVIWLTPKSVSGFNELDFDFLDEEERLALTHAVNRFRDIAKDVAPKQPAPEGKVEKALPEFQRILEIMAPNRYADFEAFRLGKKIENYLRGKIPAFVLELRFETGQDSSGDDGLWIWVVLDDKVTKNQKEFLSIVRAVRELLDNAVQSLGIKHWPYVRFRTESDLEPMKKEKVKK